MKEAFGLALALTLGLSLSAAAEETKGTVRTVDRADQSIVLDDGTRLWAVSGAPLNEIRVGDQVEVTYQIEGDKNVIVDLQREPPEVD